MKVFIIWMMLLIPDFMFLVYEDQYNRAERHMIQLKYIAEEAAAAAAQYHSKVEYSNGKMVFNQAEAIKATEFVIKTDLNLDNNFVPMAGSYWTDKVTYTINFYDDSNTTYPYLYTHNSSLFTLAIGDPTIIITINVGKPRYSIVTPPANLFRTAAHEWQGCRARSRARRSNSHSITAPAAFRACRLSAEPHSGSYRIRIS
jgi:hypothetical protein